MLSTFLSDEGVCYWLRSVDNCTDLAQPLGQTMTIPWPSPAIQLAVDDQYWDIQFLRL
jgi:hypothetical protein